MRSNRPNKVLTPVSKWDLERTAVSHPPLRPSANANGEAVSPRRTLPRMSERSRNLPRRSCLSVPGSSEKMLAKAPGLGADMVFLDLEDAVAPLEKPAARDKIVKAINEQDWGETVLCVRVNVWDTEWTTAT